MDGQLSVAIGPESRLPQAADAAVPHTIAALMMKPMPKEIMQNAGRAIPGRQYPSNLLIMSLTGSQNGQAHLLRFST